MHSATPSFIVIASGCAPPIPPSPAVSVIVPRERCPRTGGARSRRSTRTCPAGCPACRCRSTSPAVICPYIVRPSASSRRNSSHVAQSGTRFEFAISTRGAHSWVRNTPTGLPDCTSIVSSPSSVRSVRDERVERRPRRAPRARCRRRRRGRRVAPRPRGRGCSSASACAASCGQPLQVSAVPRGARTGRAPAVIAALP